MTSNTTTPIKRGPGRPRKNPLPIQRAVPVPPLRQVNGVTVVKMEPVAPLGPDKPTRIVKIFLADDTMLFGCRDCPDELDFTGGRGDVMAHRNAVHGARYGRKQPKIVHEQPTLPEALDVVLSPRRDGTTRDSLYEMTMGEILTLMPSIKALGDLIESTERERDQLLTELNGYRAFEKSNRAKLDAFDELRDELVELRMQVRQWGNYETVKAEMYELKAWKKKMIARLKGLGFQLSEEEQ